MSQLSNRIRQAKELANAHDAIDRAKQIVRDVQHFREQALYALDSKSLYRTTMTA